MAKILIVDDRVTNRELLMTLLGYAKHQVLEAVDGEEGLALAQAHYPDLIITDIVMPKMDGYEFARQVRADASIKDTQIIFYTSSYIVSETLRLAHACGVSTVIGKPIEPELLLKKIEEALNTTHDLPKQAPVSEEFHREHMRMLTDTLVKKVDELEKEILERKQVESTLQASELRFRSLIEHGLDNISMLTADGTLMWESPSATRMLGYQFNEYLGRSVFDLIHPDDVKRITHEFQELLKEPKTVRLQSFRLHHANGTWLWVDCIGTNLLDEPSVSAIVINYRDVTERKRADDTLKKNEQVLRLFVENSPASIAMFDRDMKYIVASRRYIEDYRIIEKNIVGRSHYEIFPEVPERWKEIHKRCLEGATEKSEEDAFLREDGHVDWVRWEIHPWHEPDGSIGGIILFSEVITDRKQAEEHIRYQANLLQNVSDAIIASDMSGYITNWNPAAEAMYGWTAQEAIGIPITDLLKTEYENTTLDQILKQFMQQGSWRGEALQRRKDGSKIVVFASVSLVRDSAGAPAEMVAVNRDITERKTAQDLLRSREEQYRSLFEDSPISLWLEDFSEVKKHLDTLQEKDIGDIPAYLRNHPDFVMECAKLVQILDVNTAALKLYRANDKAELMGSLVDSIPMVLDQIEYELIKLAKGELNFEREGIDQTLTGEKIFVNIHWSVVPGYEDSLARVIVSTMDVTERKRVEQKNHHQMQRLNALRAIDFAISNSFDMKLSLRVLLAGAISQLGVSAATILLFNRAYPSLEYAAGEGFDTPIIQTTNLRIGEGLAGRAALERKTIYRKNLTGIDSELVNNPLWKAEKFVSYYGVPLIAKGELKGILELFHRTELDPDQEWLDFLETLAGQAAIAIDNAQLFDGMQRSNLELSLAYDATIEGWSAALDLRDKETEGHSQRVTELTVKLAGRMGIPESELVQIRRGALLHDIGKLGVPDNILLKPAKLTNEEWEIMQKHPVYAYDMLSSISYLKYALDIPYCHHEKWDGTGYPRGLKSESIPLAARIFAIVDVWDALTSDRPYRPAWTRERTLEHIKEQSGSHFDPQVVDTFFKMMNKE